MNVVDLKKACESSELSDKKSWKMYVMCIFHAYRK